MSLGTRSIVAFIVALGMAALCLSCGPREQSGNPGTVALAEREGSSAPTPAPRLDESVVDAGGANPAVAASSAADSGTTAAAAGPADPPSQEAVAPPPAPTPSKPGKPASLPRLVDLGADKCVPCKMMAPILDELKRDYADQFGVEVIDVWKDPAPGRTYRIRVIPTQIFFDAEGRELWRHEGFLGKEDILKKWAELGVTLRTPQE